MAFTKEQYQEHYAEVRQYLLTIIGDKCDVCGSTENLHFHEIHGKKHPYGTGRFKYYLEHASDFITLCQIHHNGTFKHPNHFKNN